MKTKVLLAEDNNITRQAVKKLLNSQDNIEVIGEAEYGAFGYLLKKSKALDLVLAINEVGKGNMFLSSTITNILVRRVYKTFRLGNNSRYRNQGGSSAGL